MTSCKYLPNTKVSLLDGKGEVMQDFVTGNDGKFLFRVYENEDYNMVGETDGYLVQTSGLHYERASQLILPRLKNC